MPVTVKDLIEFLQTFPPELPVAYRCYSEQVLLLLEEIEVKECSPPRPDGWVQDKRPDLLWEQYLVFPGN
jgi:hypothetical protein